MPRILIIDDEQDLRLILREALEYVGYEVVEAGNGDEGLQHYRETPADLIITDIIMPGKGGLETIGELQRADPHVRIIAISGGSSFGYADALDIAKQLGARRVFRKPFQLPEMCQAVREALQE
jgi:CheY-like chemotaxis protein